MKRIVSTNNNNINQKSSLFKKRNFIVSSVLTSSMALTPAVVLVSQVNGNSKPITFAGQTFQNSNKLVNYIKQNSTTKTYKTESSAQWEVQLNGKTYTYSSPKDLQSALSSYITTQKRVTSLSEDKLSSYLDVTTGNVANNDFYNVTQIGDDASKVSTTKIYKGASDVEYKTEEAAYKSYYYETSAYQFDGMYFDSKSDLNTYLTTQYLVKNNNQKTKVIIKAPNGDHSAPIDLSDSSALDLIKSFVTNNAVTTINYSSSTGENLNLTKDNISDNYNAINFNDLDYLHVNTNQGKSRYIIDNSINDTHNLIGPYFYNGNLDVSSFMDKSMWKKTTDISSSVWQESKIDTAIGTFFSSIINDDNSLNLADANNSDTSSITIFRTLIASPKDPKISYDQQYLQDLESAMPSVYQEVMTALQSLLQGKKGNTFYKLPVMYSYILQRLISAGATKDIISETVDYFSKVCDYIQKALEVVILDQSLLTNKSGETFNLKDFFGIGNKEFNLNTNVEYFMEKIKKWPKLVTAMVVYNEAMSNLSMMGGLIPFSGNDNSFLVDFSLISVAEYEESKDLFEKIYNTFSQTNYSDFVKLFVKNSQLSEVQNIKTSFLEKDWESQLDKVTFFDGIILGTFLKTVIVKNTIDYNVSKAALEAEIEQYKKDKTVVDGGMLSQLGNALPSFISGIGDGTQVDVYQAYLCLLADMRRGGDILTSPSKINNTIKLINNISYFGASVLSSAVLVSDVINNVYWRSFFVRWDGSTVVYKPTSKILKPIKTCIQTAYQKVSGALSKLKRTITHSGTYITNASTFAPSVISAASFFTKVDSAIEFFQKAAPVLGNIFFILQIGLLAYQLFSSTTTTIYYVYTTADGTEFIWDGGEMVSKYLGFQVTETSTIDDMQLLKPIQYTLGQTEEYYYYDGVKYFDKNDLKIVQMNYIFSSDYKGENSHFKKKYSFINASATSDVALYDTIDDLLSGVLSSLGIVKTSDGKSIDTSKTSLNKRSPYYVGLGYSFSSGLTTDYQGSIQVVAKNILDNIRATKIVKLPTIKDGYATGDPLDTSSLVIPGKVWTPSKTIDNSSQASSYLIDNSANDTTGGTINWLNVSASDFKTSNATEAEKNASSNLFKNFKTKFSVRSKDVMNFVLSSITLNPKNLYSEVSSDSKVISTYIVSIPGRSTMTFLDEGKALNYVSTFGKAKKVVTKTSTETSYQFGNMFFATENDLKKWVHSLEK